MGILFVGVIIGPAFLLGCVGLCVWNLYKGKRSAALLWLAFLIFCVVSGFAYNAQWKITPDYPYLSLLMSMSFGPLAFLLNPSMLFPESYRAFAGLVVHGALLVGIVCAFFLSRPKKGI